MPEAPVDVFLRNAYERLGSIFSEHGFSHAQIDNSQAMVVLWNGETESSGAIVMKRSPGSTGLRIYGIGDAVDYARSKGYTGPVEKTKIRISEVEMRAGEFEPRTICELLLPKEKPSAVKAETNSEELGEFAQDQTPGN